MALSAGAKKILMAAAAKKAARKTTVKVARPFVAPVPVEAAKLPALMPCRFCKLKCVRLETGMPSMGYWVRCDNKDCLSHGPRKQSHLAAINAWNN